MKLMIVDDHEGMRRMIRHLISASGDAVLECGSGDQALQAAGDFKPDYVTMDINMAGLGAFAATRGIRAAHPPACAIFVSSHDQPDYRQMAQAAGATAYVLKEDLSELYLYVTAKRLHTRAKD